MSESRPSSTPSPARKMRAVAPVTYRKPIYEMRGQVVVRMTTDSETTANVWVRKLQGLAVKLAGFAERRFGMACEVVWEDVPVLVGHEEHTIS